MNHSQISGLSSKRGVWFELQEDYVFRTDIGTQIIPKGTLMQFLNPVLGAWRFKFEKDLGGFLPFTVSFGRSRLLKMKLKESRDENKRRT